MARDGRGPVAPLFRDRGAIITVPSSLRRMHRCCQVDPIGEGIGSADTDACPSGAPPLTAKPSSAFESSASPVAPAANEAGPPRIVAYDHVGIRVSDRRRAIAFYEALGFVERARFPEYEANEMVSAGGVGINLIFNGARRRHAANVLLDDPIKWPGMTHPAFVVDDLARLQARLDRLGIVVTEGPHRIGPRRIALFIRDPDGNVLEFNQLSPVRADDPVVPAGSTRVSPPGSEAMKLYDLELSGNCYKVRLFAALAGIDLEIVPVDFLGGEHKRAPLIDLNAWGELPVLVDGDLVLRDSQAILVYLAGRYGGEAWWPLEPARQAEIVQWLSTAANEIQNGPGAARLVDKFGYPLDKGDTLRRADRILPLLDARLARHAWLALERPTIADCAVYPYVDLAPEGGIDLAPWPNIERWFERIKGLPGYRPMPGI